MSVMITAAQVAFFREQGYLVVPDFWTPGEISDMRDELARLRSSGLLHNVATDGDGQTPSTTRENLQLCPMWPHSRLFQAMPFASRVGNAIGALLGGSCLLHLDQVFLKPAGHGSGTNWHQDNAYFEIADPLAGTALWTAVHDANIENGTLKVIPAVFTTPLDHERDLESDHHIRCYPDETNAISLEVKAGTAIFFCYGTPHATGANTTAVDRAGIAFHFIRDDQSGNAHAGFPADKRPYVSGTKACGGADVYGEDMRIIWDELTQ